MCVLEDLNAGCMQMLHLGQDPNGSDYDGRTPLMLACDPLLLPDLCLTALVV